MFNVSCETGRFTPLFTTRDACQASESAARSRGVAAAATGAASARYHQIFSQTVIPKAVTVPLDFIGIWRGYHQLFVTQNVKIYRLPFLFCVVSKFSSSVVGPANYGSLKLPPADMLLPTNSFTTFRFPYEFFFNISTFRLYVLTVI